MSKLNIMLGLRDEKKDLFKEMGTEMGNPEEVVFWLGKIIS